MDTFFKSNGRIKVFLLLAAGVFMICLVAMATLSGWIQDWLWMNRMGFLQVFSRILSVKIILAAAAFLVVFLYLWQNLRFAATGILRLRETTSDGNIILLTNQGVKISSRNIRSMLLFVSIIIGIGFAASFYSQWDCYLRFRWGGGFGQIDPIFGKDIGFYIFRLPFYELIQNGLTGLTFLTLVATGLAYGNFGLFNLKGFQSSHMDRRVFSHLSFLLLLSAAALGWGFYLDRYELLYGTRGVVYGIGYTAFHADRIGLWIMLAASAALAIHILLCMYRRKPNLILFGAGGYIVLYFLVLLVIPGIVQKFIVSPNELELETPFLKHNIDFTRKAFQLDGIVEKAYPALSDLTLEEIQQHQPTIENIRLWDWRPILQTYRQTQEFRLYYEFYHVDVDRYNLQDGYHQVMLSARELAAELPPKAQTWVNRHLQFTHGYGQVMSFVSKQEKGGLPVYVLKDIPPASDYGLKVDQPALYYGENAPGYRIVATHVNEFDYPKGNDNVYTSYHGKGGIPLDSIWKRVLFSWTQSDVNILLTSYLSPESRIQIYRGVQTRVAKIAPFLSLDHDPYMVIADGKLYWIQDAYTLSDRFPYSQPVGVTRKSVNYIRNAVKAVIDVYDGTVRFYAMNADDPILQMYRKAFPDMINPLSDLPESLKAHLRYPRDLFAIQANVHMTYHMTDPQVFYNQEDLWALPQEKYAGQSVPFQPYYILMRLPDTGELQYFLMTPFTPQGRDNMIAWMGAACDFPDYGRIILYQLPKERLTLGPMQIEAMIDQNALISQQLSLWDQRGSKVIRGNLVVIPIEKSFLYVEPVYLLAEEVNIPQLTRVIVISGDKVVMAPTLEEAVKEVFGSIQPGEVKMTLPSQAESEALRRARSNLDTAKEAIRKGSWEDFGKAMDELNKALNPGK